ncbi:MAG TPA: NAD-binding protein [Tepidisphaeraceae bacterium]|jgi:voltage-gated potassium channel
MKLKTSGFGKQIEKQFSAFWPQWPLAFVIVLIGILNILDGLRLPLTVLRRVHEINGLTESLSALGGTAQVILGVMLFVAGIGLLRRLSFAWTLALLLLITTVAINVARSRWGAGLALQTVMLGLLVLARNHFTRRTASSSIILSLSSIFAILAYGTVGSFLVGDGFRPPITDLSSAFYFTIVTLSTVGYGDIVPVSTEARWFVISLLVIGLGIFASAIASALGPKISGELQRIFNPEEKIMQLKDHVIIVGIGAVARNTAYELRSRGLPFIQIVPSKEALGSVDYPVVEGTATEAAILRQAYVEQARMVIAASEDDGENAFITLVVKDLNPNVRLLAVASSASAIRRLKLAHADLVFSPAAVGSRLLANLVEGNQISSEFRDLLEGGLSKS